MEEGFGMWRCCVCCTVVLVEDIHAIMASRSVWALYTIQSYVTFQNVASQGRLLLN
jgi:hypothetical protein